ncbi:redoxin domain-containing protein [Rhodocytophaga aerolata]|uniref:thioredoxin-dependent peroxiredoxin n=1 Tax=Rhodocytophaga aerolata TaxID=455078 RepID=A0ABT8RH24_9BACT|nr:redoxin domain-containing protein [Rhodocytophaga aerolata]MDO1450458.1 redoxin domain-containing protein [Rhodocytophaga aerolata]
MTLLLHEQAPGFSLASTSSHIFQLHQDFHNKACILFFYARDFNTTCTEEICGFRDHYSTLQKLGIAVAGISRDDIVTHIHFKDKYDLPFELLSDQKGEVSKQYQAVIPLIGVSKRISYLLNKEHKIVAVYESLFHSKRHISHMLEKLKALPSAILPV